MIWQQLNYPNHFLQITFCQENISGKWGVTAHKEQVFIWKWVEETAFQAVSAMICSEHKKNTNNMI